MSHQNEHKNKHKNDNETVGKPEFSRVVQVSDLGTHRKTLDIAAQPGELAALARRLGVHSLDGFEAQATLQILPNEDVRLDMLFEATVRQTCVVTLQTMKTKISTSFTTTYSDLSEESWGHDEEEFEDIDEDIEPPEPLIDGKIDLGEAAVEQLALEIDPFPRVKGAKFDGYSTAPKDAAGEDTGKPNPFAVLAQLKPQPDKPD